MALSVVTGANRGIGLALVQLLKERGAHVVAACRSGSADLAKLGVEIVEGVDVTSTEGVQKLKNSIGERPVELLINNAGILIWGDNLGSVDFDGMLKQFQVNAVGPLRVSQALQKNLTRGAKLGLITSRMGSIADNGSGGAYGYRASKAALNAIGMSLAQDLRASGIAVAILHPGMVKTDMVGDYGQVEPRDAAAGLLKRLHDLTLETSGGFWHANGERLPW